MNIPEQLINFKQYIGGSPTPAAVVDVQLPDLEAISETIRGAGIAGELESITPGHYGAMTLTVNYRTMIREGMNASPYKKQELEFYGAIKVTDQTSGEVKIEKLRVAARTQPKKVSPGKLDPGKGTDSNTEYSVTYIKIEIGGKVIREIDQLNFIDIIDGVDMLAEVRSALGM